MKRKFYSIIVFDFGTHKSSFSTFEKALKDAKFWEDMRETISIEISDKETGELLYTYER